MRHTSILVCGVVAAVLILDAVHARPSPEAALSGGYSYDAPSGPRLGYQQPWRGIPDSRSRANSEVTIERVPLRLVHHSTEQQRPPFYPSSAPARRGPFNFPTERQQQPYNRRFAFPSAPSAEQFARSDLNRDQPFSRNDLNRDQSFLRSNLNNDQPFVRNDQPFLRNDLPYSEPKKDYLPSPSTDANTGYTYETPTPAYTTTAYTTPEIPTTTMVTENPTTLAEHEKPRITIAISKSTVIHTGKGSYQLDEKTGLPKPIVAEAHSYAGLPEPSSTPRSVGDNLAGEGTGNFPIITKGTPPRDEEPITESEDPITEPATTTTENGDENSTPAPTAPSDSSAFSTSWPHIGQQSYSVIAPGQAQFVSLGHANPGVVSFAHNNLVPSYIQPEFAHPTYRSAYHPFAAAAAAYYPLYQPYQHQYQHYQPYITPYHNVIEYAAPAEHVPDLCRGKVVPQVAAVVPQVAAAAVVPTAQVEVQQEAPSSHKSNRLVITKGGIAIAGPGGIADSGVGGTSIVGPGGTVYSSPHGISVVGPGGKVVMQGDGTERILAKGPIVYYHPA